MSDPTTSTTTTTTDPTTSTMTATPAVPWLPNADADTVGYVQNKAWQSPADVLTGYRNIEKLMGADRAGRTVVLPTTDDAAEWAPVFDRLGRPSDASGYKLPVPEGSDAAFATAAAGKMHELGLTAKQGQELAAWWNEQAGGMTAAQQQAEQQALEAEHAGLAKDWGNERQARTELARRAAKTLGITEEAMNALEKVSGFSGTMKALAKVGDMLREHGAEGLDEVGSFGMTPEGAKSRRSQLMADKDWGKRAMNPNSAEWAELRKLDTIIAQSMQ